MDKRIFERLRNNLSDSRAKRFIEKRNLSINFLELTHAGFITEDLADSEFKEETQRLLALRAGGSFIYKSHLVFPCFNFDKEFCGFIGRATYDTTFKFQLPSHLLFSKETFMLGWQDLEDGAKTVFVSENIFEYGRLRECGKQALSLNGAFKSRFKLSVLLNRFENIVFVVDNDQAGFQLKSFIREYVNEFDREVKFVEHSEKGLDEFFIKYGKESTIKLLNKYDR